MRNEIAPVTDLETDPSLSSHPAIHAGAQDNEISFHSNGVLTLGVEIELQLIDPETGNLTSRAAEILDASADDEKIKPEFYLSTIEINTAKCDFVHDAHADLRNTLVDLQATATDLGIQFSSTGSHPFSTYSDWLISPTDRHQEIIKRNQWLTRRMSVYGLHIHIGMASGEECMRFNSFFMYFLPHLLALSSSSPFWQGIDTGLASCRPTTYESLPTAGQPYSVQTWCDFEQLYKALKACGSIRSLKDLWWDLRPSPGFGTLEIRVCDGPATLSETMAITAFIHALAYWFRDNGGAFEAAPYPPYWLARENKWRAIRYGLDAELVINGDGKIKMMREEIKEWIDILQPYVNELNYQSYFSDLNKILVSGTSTERQRKIFERTGSFEEVVKFNAREFLHQSPLTP